jgi:zinc transporter ZupT
MRSWLTILVFAIVFGILLLIGGAAGYYYLALYQLRKTELLALGAFGFA